MNIVKIDNEEEFLKDNPKREMSKIELYGTMYLLYELSQEYGNDGMTIDDIDNITYYCNRTLNIMSELRVDDFVIDSVFMLGKNKEDIFAFVGYDTEEEELFLVRIG